ncbi:MAG: phosphoglycerate dehydrogenase [Ruminococcaceae bacterium]|nr:phosphoglycerate dehydrogenase [Oscillospiraceae bacterium]
MKIIVTESIALEGIEHLKSKGFDVDVKFGISRDDLLEIIEQYDALIVRSVTKVNEELLANAPNLKVVGRAGNGVDNIDLKAATARGIIVVNTPESNIMAAAELAVTHAYAIFRNLIQAVTAGRNKDFRRGKFIGNELDGKTAGIIGLGRIGSIVARKLMGSNMNVIAYDPYIGDEKFNQLGVTRCGTLEELLKQSDLITLHTPKTPETYGMIGEKELALCKDGVRIVNAARGGLVNEKALYDALVSGKVTAAALDVLDPEPNYNKKPEEQDYENPLLTLENCIVTPHLGASTDEANLNVGTAVTKLVGEALEGKMVPAVNMPQISGGNIEEIKPYLDLAEALGRIYFQTEKKPLKKIEVIYSGDLAKEDVATGLYTLSVAKGLLSVIVPTRVNYVNAKNMLETMGIALVESKSTYLEKYTNLIIVRFTNEEKTLSVAGTVFAKSELRIVEFYGYKLDFEPSANVLAIQNRDVPGVIGRIGTVLGENGINIAAVQWSRKEIGSKAEAFVSIDQPVDEKTIQELLEIDAVLKVSNINFFA